MWAAFILIFFSTLGYPYALLLAPRGCFRGAPPLPDLYEASISELQDGLSKGYFTSVDLVQASIPRPPGTHRATASNIVYLDIGVFCSHRGGQSSRRKFACRYRDEPECSEASGCFGQRETKDRRSWTSAWNPHPPEGQHRH